MYTVCPKCALTLVVTAADLRVAQGYVRCGRCSNVFNALVGLMEERHGAVPPPPAPSPRQETPAPAQQADSEPEEPEEVFPDSELDFNPAATDVSEVFVEPARDRSSEEETGTFESIVLEGDETEPGNTPQPSDTPTTGEADEQEVDELEIDLRSLAAQLEADEDAGTRGPAREPPAAESTESADAEAADTSSPVRSQAASPSRAAPSSAPAPTSTPTQTAPPAPDMAPAFEEARDKSSLAWTIGVCALALTLAVQIVHHFRHDLATDVRLHGPLTRLYAAVGAPLVPRWDLTTYEVRQLGASADASTAGVLTVRASIKNSADQPRPLPLLRVIVHDRFGNRIAMRDVPPQAYLPSAIPPSSLMSAGQRIDAEMAFVDPGEAAVGFEIDACLPAPGSAIACANDPAAR